jgi:hypothetical protein
MIKPIKTNKRPLTIKIGVQTSSPQLIRVVASDLDKQKTYPTFYENRKGVVNGFREFEIKLPQSPTNTLLTVFNAANGLKRNGEDRSFKVVGGKVTNLVTCPIWMSPETVSFLKFAKKFAENASNFTAGDKIPHIYRSEDGQFTIDYYIRIRDRKTGRFVSTPARIGHTNGVIEVSKKAFLKYSVPMRIIILLHEFSHKWLNPAIGRKISYETGADIAALNIYLSEGYPDIEAHNAFLYVFKDANNKSNHHRYKIIKDFIDKFSKGEIQKCFAKSVTNTIKA